MYNVEVTALYHEDVELPALLRDHGGSNSGATGVAGVTRLTGVPGFCCCEISFSDVHISFTV